MLRGLHFTVAYFYIRIVYFGQYYGGSLPQPQLQCICNSKMKPKKLSLK